MGEPAAETKRRGGARKQYSAPALEKGLDIIEFLSERSGDFGLADIASGIGRTKGEIFRMLAVLEQRDYLRRDATSDRYRVTDKLFRLGLSRPKIRDLTDLARPLMQDFSDVTRFPCHLAVATGGQIAIIARADSPDHVGLTVQVGHRIALTRSGSGLCLLAYMNDRGLDRAFAALELEEPGLNRETLDNRLKNIRKAGVVVEPSSVIEGVWDIAVPIMPTDGTAALAALCVPYVHYHNNPVAKEEISGALKSAARRINDLLAAAAD